jgi:hypothetical protein
MKRAIILPALVTAFVALSPVGVALADNPHGAGDNPNPTGQPSQEATLEPGSSPPGFLTGIGQGATTKGFANAEAKYAGSFDTPSANHTVGTPAEGIAVSQYDVAGFQFCTHRGTCNN